MNHKLLVRPAHYVAQILQRDIKITSMEPKSSLSVWEVRRQKAQLNSQALNSNPVNFAFDFYTLIMYMSTFRENTCGVLGPHQASRSS
jgi:hypothetical protein